MENQNNDDAIEVTAQNSNNTNNTDNGEPPHLVRASDLPEFIHKPSGNTVRIRCPAAGKLIKSENERNFIL